MLKVWIEVRDGHPWTLSREWYDRGSLGSETPGAVAPNFELLTWNERPMMKFTFAQRLRMEVITPNNMILTPAHGGPSIIHMMKKEGILHVWREFPSD